MNYYHLFGDFDCLKAAVQNGADAVYLGASNFNARFSAKNFTLEDLEKAIDYAHIRNCKVYLTLNTLILESELIQAFSLAKSAYNYGIDGIIVQDFGLAKLLIKKFPDLPIHASTQMTVTNLNGVTTLKKLGFKRVVLARELSLNDVRYICENSGIDIECFVHGALCISHSGQCLFSSMIGGRSGNRGKCAQACRLPYELIENKKNIDHGYLLSPKDLCTLEILPELIDAGIHSFKIEGRMKTPEYVATVTRIYRKYIDKVLNCESFIVDPKDIDDLKQVFNRGGFSTGHYSSDPNLELIFKDKPNNMGIYVGNVSNYNSNKGHITINLAESLSIGDIISFEKESTKYTISELIIKQKNIASAYSGQCVTVGRMKGNISIGDKIYRMSSKKLTTLAEDSYKKIEQKKLKLICHISIKENSPIELTIKPLDIYENCEDTEIKIKSDIIPVKAINSPITKERIISQLSKTKDTPFEFNKIIVDLDDNLYIPSISALNALRRNSLLDLEKKIVQKYKRNSNEILDAKTDYSSTTIKNVTKKTHVSLLLNILNTEYDYSKLKDVDSIYVPLKYFASSKYLYTLLTLSEISNLYIYLPTIIRNNFKNLFMDKIERALSMYKIKGFVLSNIGSFELLKEYKDSYRFIGNYTLNVFNSETFNGYIQMGLNKVTLSPELNKENLVKLNNKYTSKSECIVYGSIPLMTTRYCLLGKTNKCYPECSTKCNTNNKYYLKDRMGFLFRVIPDNMQTITTIYNSKITSISNNIISSPSIRIDTLDETIDEINTIISKAKKGERLEGQNYTNGNLYRNV